MILHCDSNAAYLVEKKARNKAGGYYYLSSNKNPILNGAIYCEYCIIDVVMSSAVESEVGTIFYNARNIMPMRITIEELGHL